MRSGALVVGMCAFVRWMSDVFTFGWRSIYPMDIVNGRNKEPLISDFTSDHTDSFFRFPFLNASPEIKLSKWFFEFQTLCNNIFPFFVHKPRTLASLSWSFAFLPLCACSSFLFWASVPLRKVHQKAMTNSMSDNMYDACATSSQYIMHIEFSLAINWRWMI